MNAPACGCFPCIPSTSDREPNRQDLPGRRTRVFGMDLLAPAGRAGSHHCRSIMPVSGQVLSLANGSWLVAWYDRRPVVHSARFNWFLLFGTVHRNAHVQSGAIEHPNGQPWPDRLDCNQAFWVDDGSRICCAALGAHNRCGWLMQEHSRGAHRPQTGAINPVRWRRAKGTITASRPS